MTDAAHIDTALDMDAAAHALGWSRRSLQIFLQNTPADRGGNPFYYPNGKRRLFTPADIDRIRQYVREEERCRLSSSRRKKVVRRASTPEAPTSDDSLAKALALAAEHLPSRSSDKSNETSKVVFLNERVNRHSRMRR